MGDCAAQAAAAIGSIKGTIIMSVSAVFFLHCVLLLTCTAQEVAAGAVLCGYNVPLVEYEQPAAF
jgi:hypothetical protein